MPRLRDWFPGFKRKATEIIEALQRDQEPLLITEYGPDRFNLDAEG